MLSMPMKLFKHKNALNGFAIDKATKDLSDELHEASEAKQNLRFEILTKLTAVPCKIYAIAYITTYANANAHT